MKAVKANKEYAITEAEKKGYIDQGYDIVGDDGKVVEYGRGKAVPYEDHMKVVKELEAIKSKGKKAKESEDSKTDKTE